MKLTCYTHWSTCSFEHFMTSFVMNKSTDKGNLYSVSVSLLVLEASSVFNHLFFLFVDSHFLFLQRFNLLDKNGDGFLTTDDVISLPPEVVEEAFGGTHPGEVREDFVVIFPALFPFLFPSFFFCSFCIVLPSSVSFPILQLLDFVLLP